MKTKIVTKEALRSDANEFLETLNKESDTVRVIVGTAFVDALLVGRLKDRLRESDVTDRFLTSGFLGNFQARADLSYSLHLIDKPIYQDLCKIAVIRNRFAHSHLNLSFIEPEIVRLCNDLTIWGLLYLGDPTPIASDRKFLASIAVIVDKFLSSDASENPPSIKNDIYLLGRIFSTIQPQKPVQESIANPAASAQQSWSELEKSASSATSTSDPFATAIELANKKILSPEEAKGYYQMSDVIDKINRGADIDVASSSIFISFAYNLVNKISKPPE